MQTKPLASQQTRFLPSQHGFRFCNSFIGLGLPWINAMPWLTQLLKTDPYRHGLCGGMCFAALDHFWANRPIPATDEVPSGPSALYRYLDRRQVNTYRRGWVIGLFFLWTARSDVTLQRLTITEINRVKQRLDQGEPVVLGLILTQSVRKLTTNHQVIAYGYRENESGITLQIYDPSIPNNNEVVIEVTLSETGATLTEHNNQTHTSRPIRGLFIIPYKPVAPSLSQP